MSLYNKESWRKIMPRAEESTCQNLDDCIILDTVTNACKKSMPEIEVINVSDDGDSNASTVVDVSNLGTISDIDPMIEVTYAEKIGQPYFNGQLIYHHDNQNVMNNNSPSFSDLTLQINDNFNLNDNKTRSETTDELDKIKISKVESLTERAQNYEKDSNGNNLLIRQEENQKFSSENPVGIDFKIKEKNPDSPDGNLEKYLSDGNESQLSLDVSDVLQKYLPFVEFQNIPLLVSNINSNQQLEPLDLSKKLPTKKVVRYKKVCRDNRYKCPYCSFADPHRDALKYHLFLHVDTDLSCTICSEKFFERSLLVDHIIGHHSFCSLNGRRCQICYKVFADRYNTVLHFETHKKDGLFSCNTCCYMVKTVASFKDHLAKHMMEKFVFCDDCGRSFANKNKLAKHWCDYHGKLEPFKEKKILKRRRYRCESCDQAYKRYDHFKRHILKVHGI